MYTKFSSLLNVYEFYCCHLCRSTRNFSDFLLFINPSILSSSFFSRLDFDTFLFYCVKFNKFQSNAMVFSIFRCMHSWINKSAKRTREIERGGGGRKRKYRRRKEVNEQKFTSLYMKYKIYLFLAASSLAFCCLSWLMEHLSETIKNNTIQASGLCSIWPTHRIASAKNDETREECEKFLESCPLPL